MNAEHKTESSVAEALNSLLGGVNDKSDMSNRAARAWYEFNGNDEAKHTVGIYLKEDEGGNTLFVYIDSSAKLQDYNTNKLIYLARLEPAEMDITDIQFKLSKYKKKKTGATKAAKHFVQHKEVLPDIPQDELCGVLKDIEKLSPELQSAISKAAESSLKRQRAEGTQE